jgi:hypothetical protein
MYMYICICILLSHTLPHAQEAETTEALAVRLRAQMTELAGRRTQVYAHVCSRMLTYAGVCLRMLTYAGRRTHVYADVC